MICEGAGAPEKVTEDVCGSLYDIYHNDRYFAENTISLESSLRILLGFKGEEVPACVR